MIYFELFIVFVQVGLLSIGGGYAAIPVIQDLIVGVGSKNWLTPEQFSELITIAEMTPGPITLNASTFVGEQLAGVGGAIIATFSCVLPSFIIVSIIAVIYRKFSKLAMLQGVLKQLRPVIVGLIASSCAMIVINAFWGGIDKIAISTTDWAMIVTFAICFILLRIKVFRINPVLILIFSGGIGLAIQYVPYLFMGG